MFEKPLIITAAINGGGKPRSRSPAQPILPTAIVCEAIDAWRAGAAIIHFHARGDDGHTTMDPDAHRRIIEQIRASGCDAIMNVSCGDDGGRAGHDVRIAMIGCGAEMVSFTASSYNSGARLYDNRPEFLHTFCGEMRRVGVKPDIELLDIGWVSRLDSMVESGALDLPYHCVLGFGLSGGMPPEPVLCRIVVDRLPRGAVWTAACITDRHSQYLSLMLAAFAAGGHVRTGIEDCPWLSESVPAPSNAALVEQWVATATAWSRPVASPAQARELLGLNRHDALHLNAQTIT
jgi:3-keto-5-aminohexanoate cleavage enzyme